MGRLRAHLAGEAGGVTLAELIATMVLGLLIGAAALMGIEGTRSSSVKTTARQEAVADAESALQRMTREIHQATQAAVISSTQMDVKTRVRNSANNTLQLRRIRFNCNTSPSAQYCERIDCGATSLNGSLVPASCSSGQITPIIKGVLQAQFTPRLDTTSPATPTESIDFVEIRLRVRLDDFASGRESVSNLDPIELIDGVEFANLDN